MEWIERNAHCHGVLTAAVEDLDGWRVFNHDVGGISNVPVRPREEPDPSSSRPINPLTVVATSSFLPQPLVLTLFHTAGGTSVAYVHHTQDEARTGRSFRSRRRCNRSKCTVSWIRTDACGNVAVLSKKE